MADGEKAALPKIALPQPWLLISDLDGTILDHWTYSPAAMLPVLEQLEARQIPVVFNTSKTAAELEPLRQQLHNHHPFIVENGSAIYLPRHYFSHHIAGIEIHGDHQRIILGAIRRDISQWLQEIQLRGEFNFVSFSSLSAAEVAELAGMNEGNAALAQRRHFSETIDWRDSKAAYAKFCEAARKAGFTTLQGGRFIHLLGRSNKGLASQRLAQEYQQHHGRQPSLIVCGDGANDVDMLRIADLALLVRSPNHGLPQIDNPQGCVAVSPEPGPAGLARLLLEVLSLP